MKKHSENLFPFAIYSPHDIILFKKTGANMVAEELYKRKAEPLLIVISGPSGVGKDTIARSLIDTNPDNFYFVVTATTRPPRAGEINGTDYFFVSNDEFATMIDNNDLLEYAVVYNDFKGIPKKQIRDAMASGRDVIMRVDVQGAATIRKFIPNAITIFLTTESESELIRRLNERRSETPDGLSLRIATARQEMNRIKEFNYWVINPEGEPTIAVQQIASIIEAAHCEIGREPVKI